MGCVKDKLVYVPINESDNLNTLKTIIRTPSEAGILSVKVKRKQDFKQSYQEVYNQGKKLSRDSHQACKTLLKQELDYIFLPGLFYAIRSTSYPCRQPRLPTCGQRTS